MKIILDYNFTIYGYYRPSVERGIVEIAVEKFPIKSHDVL